MFGCNVHESTANVRVSSPPCKVMRNNTLKPDQAAMFWFNFILGLSTNFILLQVFPILVEEIDREVRMATDQFAEEMNQE